MSSIQIANTIIEQMGGADFIKFASDFVPLDGGVRFDVVLNPKGISCVEIKLIADEYQMVFYQRTKIPTMRVIQRAFNKNVYCDQLIEFFELNTGLVTGIAPYEPQFEIQSW